VSAATPPWREPEEKAIWEILPGLLWQSGSPVDWETVAAHGIDTVVDVNGDGDRRLEPVEWFRSESILYLFWPLTDGRVPDPHDLDLVVDVVVRRIAAGHRALVHCSAGQNRSGLVSALVVRAVRGVSGAEALAYVDRRRELPLSNTAFAAYLRSLT
jgi:protein-tyrosine phosphatase